MVGAKVGPAVTLYELEVAQGTRLNKVTQLAQLPGGLGVQFARGKDVKQKHDAAYWAKATAGFDFSDADRVPPQKFNKVLWKGLMGHKRYPLLANQAEERVDD